jgi:hypothetical protein
VTRPPSRGVRKSPPRITSPGPASRRPRTPSREGTANSCFQYLRPQRGTAPVVSRPVGPGISREGGRGRRFREVGAGGTGPDPALDAVAIARHPLRRGCCRWTTCSAACARQSRPSPAPHRCFRRHGISRLPRAGEKVSRCKRFAETTIGYVHIDVRELRLTQGKLFMFLAIDRVSKFVRVAFFDANTKLNGAAFLREVVEVFPLRAAQRC